VPRERQRDAKSRAIASDSLERLNTSAVRFNNAPCGCKTKAISTRLGGVIRLEGVLNRLGRQSWTSVFHLNGSAAWLPTPAICVVGMH